MQEHQGLKKRKLKPFVAVSLVNLEKGGKDP